MSTVLANPTEMIRQGAPHLIHSDEELAEYTRTLFELTAKPDPTPDEEEAIELMEQFGWEVPDHIIVPGGNLGNSSAIGKALLEMLELKLISRLPKLSIIQAQGANPFYCSVHDFGGTKIEPMTADTIQRENGHKSWNGTRGRYGTVGSRLMAW